MSSTNNGEEQQQEQQQQHPPPPKPNLPLSDIASFDASSLKHTAEQTVDKTGVNDHDKLLSAVAGGQLPAHLKHVDEADAKVKEWHPTREDVEADAKQREMETGVPRG